MAAKQTTKKPTSGRTGKTSPKKTVGRKRKQQEKKRSAVPFLLIIILILLGIIAYAYRDKLEVLLASGMTALRNREQSGKEDSKDKQKPKHSDSDSRLQKAINNLEKKTAAAPATTTTVRRAVPVTTTTTVKQPVTTTTAAATVKPKQEKRTITAAAASTTTTTVRRTAPVTTTTVRTDNAVKSAVRTRTSRVYFTKVTMDDTYLVEASREVHYTDSPLTETIKVLLQGTTAAEDKQYIVTNIPDNTRLLSARIANNTAYLNFSDEFENNFYGRESSMYQLKQIVYTATEFNGVNAVQILINGEKKEYLGGEGILIGEPLRKQDFESYK